MPAVSKKQQHLFAMVHALKSGSLKPSSLPKSLADKVEKVSKTISDKSATDFAKTKGLKENMMTFIQFLFVESEITQTFTDDEIKTILEIEGITVASVGDEDEEKSKPKKAKEAKKKSSSENQCGGLREAWDKDDVVNPAKKGMFKGKSKTDLESELSSLKKSGPHKEGSPQFTRMKEVEFALRAKNGWGKAE